MNKSVATGLVLGMAAALGATQASAGVMATAYLRVTSLVVEVDVNNDGTPDVLTPQQLASLISITGGTRQTTTSVNMMDGTQIDSDVDSAMSATGLADAAYVCVPAAACTGFGLVNNAATLANLINDVTETYAAGDAVVDGNAVGAGASGMTYADASIASGSGQSTANGTIQNSVTSTISVDVNTASAPDVRIRFVAIYEAFTEALITPDVLSDPTILGIASATSRLSFTAESATVPRIIDSTLSNTRIWSDPGAGFAPLTNAAGSVFATNWGVFQTGSYQVNIDQTSTATVTQIPTPATLGLLGLGLLGLGAARRRLGATSA